MLVISVCCELCPQLGRGWWYLTLLFSFLASHSMFKCCRSGSKGRFGLTSGMCGSLKAGQADTVTTPAECHHLQTHLGSLPTASFQNVFRILKGGASPLTVAQNLPGQLVQKSWLARERQTVQVTWLWEATRSSSWTLKTYCRDERQKAVKNIFKAFDFPPKA